MKEVGLNRKWKREGVIDVGLQSGESEDDSNNDIVHVRPPLPFVVITRPDS